MSPGPLPKIINQIIAWLSGSESSIPDWSEEEWQLFKKATFIHGVAPILHKNLATAHLPQPVQDWLQSQYDHNHHRITRLQADLRAILAAFAAANIPIMPLKGAVLTNFYYDDIALRPTADIDLLIHPQDYQHSLTQLARLGYEIEKSNWKHAILSRPDNRAVISYEVEHPDNPRRLDLHLTCREMFSGPYVDITAAIWSTATPGQLLGQPAYLPGPDMLQRHLLLHTSSNIWNAVLRLINLLDLTHLAQKSTNQPNQPNQPNHQSPITQLPNYQLPITNHPITKSPITNHPITQLPITNYQPIPPRFLYPALHFLQQYLPHPAFEEPLARCESAVPTSLKRWLSSQDIISRSRLSKESKRSYLARLFILYSAHPKDLLFALHFLTRRLTPNSPNTYIPPSE